MSQEITLEEIFQAIVSKTGLSREEIRKKIGDTMAGFNGLLTEVGTALILAEQLGVNVNAPPPRSDVNEESKGENGRPATHAPDGEPGESPKDQGAMAMVKVTYRGRVLAEVDEDESWLVLTRKDIERIADVNGLDRLVNLRGLHLDENHISKIEGLDRLVNLKSLNLNQNNITKIEGLERLVDLREIYISFNEIERLEGLDQLEKLVTLYLGGNNIRKIEGLDRLVNLQVLRLGYNLITRIEGLDRLVELQEIDLRGNDITDVNDIIRLLGMRSLGTVSIDFERLKGLKKENVAGITDFLIKQYTRKKSEYYAMKEKPLPPRTPHRGNSFPKNRYLFVLEDLTQIANILINFLHERDWMAQQRTRQELEGFLDERIALEGSGTAKQHKLRALKCVILAGLEATYDKQLPLLEEASHEFDAAGERACSLVHGAHACILRVEAAIGGGHFDKARAHVRELVKQCADLDETGLDPAIRAYLHAFAEIEGKVTEYIAEPGHLLRLRDEAMQKCKQVLAEAMPSMQLGRPGIYRLLYGISKNIQEEVWAADERRAAEARLLVRTPAGQPVWATVAGGGGWSFAIEAARIAGEGATISAVESMDEETPMRAVGTDFHFLRRNLLYFHSGRQRVELRALVGDPARERLGIKVYARRKDGAPVAVEKEVIKSLPPGAP